MLWNGSQTRRGNPTRRHPGEAVRRWKARSPRASRGKPQSMQKAAAASLGRWQRAQTTTRGGASAGSEGGLGGGGAVGEPESVGPTSPAGPGWAGAGASASRRAPQLPQKRSPGALGCWHAAHTGARVTPHLWQVASPAAISTPQLWQFISCKLPRWNGQPGVERWLAASASTGSPPPRRRRIPAWRTWPTPRRCTWAAGAAMTPAGRPAPLR